MSDAVDWFERYGTPEDADTRIYVPRSSDSEQIPKPVAREAAGDRVERLDGLHASEASGGSSAIQPGGAGKATEGSAEPEALRDERSQLPDGLPSRGDGESELLPCPFCGVVPILFDADYRIDHAEDCYLRMISVGWIVGAASNRIRQWNKRAGNASVKPIPSHQGTTHLVRRTLDGVVGRLNDLTKNGQ